MRPSRHLALHWGALFVAATAMSAVCGCSPGGHGGKAASPSAHSSTPARSLPPGAIGISPGGVTTRVDVPAESTEEEYFQACHAARVWMDSQGGSGEGLIEPYLRMVQASTSGVAGSWNTRWADLSTARQAGVIVAAQAAARGECG